MSKKEAEVKEKPEATEKPASKGDKGKKKPSQDKSQLFSLKKGEKIKDDLKYIVRIAGTDLDGRRKLKIVLPRVRGVGYNFSNAVLRALKIDDNMITGKLTDEQISQIESAVKNPASVGIPTFLYDRRKDPIDGKDNHWVGSDWDYGQREGIEFLKKLKTYRGMRHFYGMKLRGQRTKSRGGGQGGRSGKTIGVVRKKLAPGQQPTRRGDKK